MKNLVEVPREEFGSFSESSLLNPSKAMEGIDIHSSIEESGFD
jgi:hypothetical protein